MTEFITRNYGNESFEVIIKTDSKEHYKATENFARRLIDHAKPVTDNNVGSKWIPVTERLPEHENPVLCFIKNGQQDILQFDKFENLWIGMQWTYKRHAVTHWMPLPEPPKEEANG